MKTKAQEIETLAKLVAGTYDCPYLNEALRIVEAQFKQDITSDFITVVSIRDSIDARLAAQAELAAVRKEIHEAKILLAKTCADGSRAERALESVKDQCHQLSNILKNV